MSSTVTVDDLATFVSNAPQVAGFALDVPTVGYKAEAHSIPLVGWVLPHQGRPMAIEIVSGGAVFGRFAFNDNRPDVQEAFPSYPDAASCAFRCSVSTLGLAKDFELVLRVELADSHKVPLFTIRGTRKPLELGQEGVLQPILLSNIGRSGSTWVTQLLGHHPDIVTYRPFEYEPRIATYWMDIVRHLAQPHSYRQAVDPEVRNDLWWLGTDRSKSPPTFDDEEELYHYVEKSAIEEIADFGRGRIDRFYRVVAETQGRPSARYYLERFFGTGPMAARFATELYSGSKELFLVRDYRDVLCSIRSYNERTGLRQFGRDVQDGDEAYVRGFFSANVRALADRWRQRREGAYLLRYEDLVLRPRDTLASLLGYLELASDDDVVARTLDDARQDRFDRQRQHMTTADPRASIGRWRDQLSPELLLACSESFDDVLRDFGYEEG